MVYQRGLVGAENRIYQKALANELVIAVGSGASPSHCSIPALCRQLREKFPQEELPEADTFRSWNAIVDTLLGEMSKERLLEILNTLVGDPELGLIHRNLAAVPVSNFIDLTFDRSLAAALQEAGRVPTIHDWKAIRIGEWQQTTPDRPNVFFALPGLRDGDSWPSPYVPLDKLQQLADLMFENMREMVRGRDLLLIGVSAEEAHDILQIFQLCLAADKIYVESDAGLDRPDIWVWYGVKAIERPLSNLMMKLLPSAGDRYTRLDGLFPRQMLIDVSRDKKWDVFISHFHGDKPFVNKLAQDLHLRDIHVWVDENEILVGDSIIEKINKGLKESYSFAIVLTEEALARPFVRKELNSAVALGIDGKMKVLPIVYKDCELPPLLADYRYADFRDERLYQEQLALLTRSIGSVVNKARKKG